MNFNADFLPCSRCVEFLEHSRDVYKRNEDIYKITGTYGIPQLRRGSPLNLYPVLQRYCVYTIQEGDGEESEEEDEEFSRQISSRDPHRPLFYTELSAKGFNVLRDRVSRKHPLAALRRRRRSHK